MLPLSRTLRMQRGAVANFSGRRLYSSQVVLKRMTPHTCDTTMEFVKLLQSSDASTTSRVEGLRLLLRKHSETAGEDPSGRGLSGSSDTASASGMPSLAATISFMCATPSSSSTVDNAEARGGGGHQLGIECTPSQRLIVALSSAEDLQRRMCLQFLEEVNSGTSTRSHVHSVAFHLLRQLQLAVAEDTTRVIKDSAGRSGDKCPDATLERDLKVLHVELLCLLATLAATGHHRPTSASSSPSGDAEQRPSTFEQEAANSAAMTDACFWIGELCAVLRMHAKRDNGVVSLGTARQALALLLPLLQNASISDKAQFQQALRNVYAATDEEVHQPFSTAKKVHFVVCVCLPFAALHYGVVPLLNASRQTQISIAVGIALLVAYMAQWLWSTPPPPPAPITPKVLASTTEGSTGSPVSKPKPSMDILATLTSNALTPPASGGDAQQGVPANNDSNRDATSSSSSNSKSSLSVLQVAMEAVASEEAGDGTIDEGHHQGPEPPSRPWWKRVLSVGGSS